jgi:hypothetical protein
VDLNNPTLLTGRANAGVKVHGTNWQQFITSSFLGYENEGKEGTKIQLRNSDLAIRV